MHLENNDLQGDLMWLGDISVFFLTISYTQVLKETIQWDSSGGNINLRGLGRILRI